MLSMNKSFQLSVDEVKCGCLVIQFQETHLLQMGKKRGKKIFNKEEMAEDWCFDCKDGGKLMICDYGKCLKAYHPACVEKDDSVWTSDKKWICGWHSCLICKEPSNYQCYCCDRAACTRCIRKIDFVHHKGKYGFCNNCLKLALLVEEDRNIDSDGVDTITIDLLVSQTLLTPYFPLFEQESVDLRDWETYEGLFREYYLIVKAKEKFGKNLLLAGKAKLDKEKTCQISSYSDKDSEEEDEQFSLNNEVSSDGETQKKRLKKDRCAPLKTKMHKKVNPKKKEFVGWGSKALIDFLQFIGKDTRQKLSKYDVSATVIKYIKEHNLIDPVKKTRIICDVQLEAVFGKKVVNRRRILSLLESHFVNNEERLQNDELDHDLEDDETEILVAPETEESVEQNKMSSMCYSIAPQSQFAALIPENIRLIYLKGSLVLEIIKQPESIETKIIGSVVRVKFHPRAHKQRNSHQLVQITGIKHGSIDTCNNESLVLVSNTAGDVCLTMLSDAEISKEECDVMREQVKAGLLKKITIEELEQKAKILHEDILKHDIAQELQLLEHRISRANEKGWRDQLSQHLQRREVIQERWYLAFKLLNIPGVIPEEVEHESLAKDESVGSKMHHCKDETTPVEQKDGAS